MMIKTILTAVAIALGVWAVWFWWLCYLNWEILNPIQALIDTPTITWGARLANIFIFTVVVGASIAVAIGVNNDT